MAAARMFPLEQIEAAMSDQTGFCLECGKPTDSMVEPDARRYKCDCCGALAVYGAEQLIIMGRVR